MMSVPGPRLSAYLDGALDPAEMATIRARLADDPALRAELASLIAANDQAKADFADMFTAPLPLSLVRGLATPEPARAAPRRMPRWSALAASVALLALGALGGYSWAPADPDRDWVAEIGEYHAVYAAQKRHLAEVPGSQAAHIREWLATNVGVDAAIPDLSAQGLTFEGGRLLVAAGKPVGQLMYKDAAGVVFAVCFTQSDKAPPDAPQPRQFDDFDGLVWGVPGGRFLIIGPKGDSRLPALAAAAQSV